MYPRKFLLIVELQLSFLGEEDDEEEEDGNNRDEDEDNEGAMLEEEEDMREEEEIGEGGGEEFNNRGSAFARSSSLNLPMWLNSVNFESFPTVSCLLPVALLGNPIETDNNEKKLSTYVYKKRPFMPSLSMRMPVERAPSPQAREPNKRCFPYPSFVPSVNRNDAAVVKVEEGAVIVLKTLTKRMVENNNGRTDLRISMVNT